MAPLRSQCNNLEEMKQELVVKKWYLSLYIKKIIIENINYISFCFLSLYCFPYSFIFILSLSVTESSSGRQREIKCFNHCITISLKICFNTKEQATDRKLRSSCESSGKCVRQTSNQNPKNHRRKTHLLWILLVLFSFRR